MCVHGFGLQTSEKMEWKREGRREGGGDAPGTEEEILGVSACICQMLEEIEGKDCICHIKFFHCLNLEGKRGKATALQDDSTF